MIRILTDSTSDLSPELLEKYGITVLPLHVLLGEDEYLDGVNITPDWIYQWSDQHKTTPKTSAPSLADAQDILEKLLADEEDEVIAFSISAGMSTSGNVIRMAADMLEASERVRVIDSMNLSTGIGLLILKAAEMAQKGMEASEIVNEIEEIRLQVRASFVVDTLEYLYRGGRCSGVAALAGGMLRLHPLIAVTDGAMAPGKKYRGKMDHVILSYVKDLEADMANADKARVFITHSGCDQAIIDSVYRELEAMEHFDEILVTRAGSVISSHCGPGTLGVLFIQ